MKMKYEVLTIAREYGSGGAEIARVIAASLGWKLLDNALIAEIGKRAKVPAREAADLDELVDPWVHRLTRPLWGRGGDGYSAIAPVDLFDAGAAAGLAEQIIKETYRAGRCVIVGRGAQCVLQGKEGVFHAFVYASWADRVRRLQSRLAPGTNVEETLRSMEAERLGYVRFHYGKNRLDPHLYDLMINSKIRPEAVARLIVLAMEAV